MTSYENIEICEPKDQLKLYGYENYFKKFITIYENNRLPNVVLLTGPRGIGKSTFVYHFINYLLSSEEQHKYSTQNFEIEENNASFKLVSNNSHPNFFLLESNSLNGNIKIDQVRELLKFTSKTNYYKNLKILLLDNAELLNLNSANALLKVLEEPTENTFFFIIHSDSSFILDTIKSRSLQFKFHFSLDEKKNIFTKITKNYDLIYKDSDIKRFLYIESPGNLLKYLLLSRGKDFNISEGNLSFISALIDKYLNKNDHELLNFISLLIENFYNELSLKNSTKINNYLRNKNKISFLIKDMKKFNLDKRNLFFSIGRILKNETE